MILEARNVEVNQDAWTSDIKRKLPGLIFFWFMLLAHSQPDENGVATIVAQGEDICALAKALLRLSDAETYGCVEALRSIGAVDLDATGSALKLLNTNLYRFPDDTADIGRKRPLAGKAHGRLN